jgi:hypothetical protein
MSGFSHWLLEHFPKFRKLGHRFIVPVKPDRKAEAKLVPPLCPASGIRGCPADRWRHLAPLLSRPLWLYSRAMQTEALADASL